MSRQCSTSLFSLTSFYELSNEAFLTSTSIILGIPVPHALYLQATQRQYSNTDVWADSLLNKSNHAADSRKLTHAKLAQELTKIAIECGIPTTCNESRLPYRDEGQDQQSRKRADMMTLTGCGINPNPELDFTSNTRVIMDVTIGHTFTMSHQYKANNLRTMEATKRRKYNNHYLRQRLAFAPMVANTLGQCGPDLLQFLWILADHHAQLNMGLPTEMEASLSTQQESDYRKIRGLKYHENRLRILTCIFEGITTRIFGSTFNLTCSPAYHRWLDQTRQNWLPLLPTTDNAPPTPSSQSSPDPSLPQSPSPSCTGQEQPSPQESQDTATDEAVPTLVTSEEHTASVNFLLSLNARVVSHRRHRSESGDTQDLRPSQRRRTLAASETPTPTHPMPTHSLTESAPLPNQSL